MSVLLATQAHITFQRHRLITSFFASRLAELDAKQIETVADALGCGEEFSALLARHTKDGQQQIDIS